MVFIGFPYGFALFWVVPFGFSLFFVSVLVLKEKPKENYWKTNPSRLRDLSGASFWASLASACSGAPSPGLPLSLSLLASSGLLWLALPPSFLSLSSFTRNKEEIRLWGLSGASVWGPLSFLFHALWREGERRIPSGLEWCLISHLTSIPMISQTPFLGVKRFRRAAPASNMGTEQI